MNSKDQKFDENLAVWAGQMASALRDLGPSDRSQALAAFQARVLSFLAMSDVKVPPEVKAQALAEINEEEILAEVRQVRESGGLALRDLVDDLEKVLPRG